MKQAYKPPLAIAAAATPRPKQQQQHHPPNNNIGRTMQPTTIFFPECECGEEAYVQRKKAGDNAKAENRGREFFVCDNCNGFLWCDLWRGPNHKMKRGKPKGEKYATDAMVLQQLETVIANQEELYKLMEMTWRAISSFLQPKEEGEDETMKEGGEIENGTTTS